MLKPPQPLYLASSPTFRTLRVFAGSRSTKSASYCFRPIGRIATRSWPYRPLVSYAQTAVPAGGGLANSSAESSRTSVALPGSVLPTRPPGRREHGSITFGATGEAGSGVLAEEPEEEPGEAEEELVEVHAPERRQAARTAIG